MAALLVLALGTSACSGGNRVVGAAPAATVDGTTISQAEVQDLTAANLRFYREAGKLGQDGDGQLAALADTGVGTGRDTQAMSEAVASLDSLITSTLIHDELARLDALPSKADRASVRTSLETAVGGKDKLAKFDEAFIAATIESRALTEAYQRYLAEKADKAQKTLTPDERAAQMQALYEQTAPTRPLCVNAIQVATEAEATDARTRVDGGEDFIAVATDLAPDGVTVPEEGLVACLSFENATAAFGTDLSTAELGDVVGPVPYTAQQGAAPVYLVLRVDGLNGPTYDQMQAELEAAVPAEPPATDPTQVDIVGPVAALAAKADITINPVYGTWNEETSTIEAPVVPATPGATSTTLVAATPGS